MNISQQKKFYYWILPLVSMTILVFMNYSGIELFQTIVSPEINREFGLLENLQLLVLAIIFIVCIRSISSKRHQLENLVFGFLSLIFFVAFLEEIDYGIHYYEYFFNSGVEDKSIVRNLHNQGNNNFYLRQATYVVMVLCFVVLPLLKEKIKIPFIQHFCADKMIISSFAVYLFVGQLARRLPQWGMEVNESLRGNHQEFEELVFYYIILLYLYEVARVKAPLLAKK